jgi:hypothetical protein
MCYCLIFISAGSHFYARTAAESWRRIRDRKAYSDAQNRRWGRLMGKLLVIAMEDTFGKVIRQHHDLRPVFAASAIHGLRHLDDMPWIEGRPTVRLLKFTGESETELKDFLKNNSKKVALLTDADHYEIVAAGMLKG